MNINVTARHMTLTPAMHEYAVHKITRALKQKHIEDVFTLKA